MKFITALAFCMFMTLQALQAQPPQALNYQAIARTAAGSPVQNQNIALRTSIVSDSATGTVLYSETFSVATNQFGLFTVNVGTGNVLTGVFSQINWALSAKWLKVEMDITGGTYYQLMNTSQLLSVPYAFYSANSANALNVNTSISPTGDTLYIGSSWYIVPGISGH